MWTNGGYFLGTVTGAEGDRFDILFEDGDRLAVDATNVVALREDTPFAVGDHVTAAWNGVAMYPGVITKVHAKSCMVKWDDGDVPLLVAKDKIFHSNKTVTSAFSVGEHVMAVWQGSSKYPGVVTEVRGDSYLIKWDDGDTPLWVTEDKINRMGSMQTAAFSVGEHVMAVWKGSSMYPGVIAEVRGDQYLIKWDDGDVPLWVSKDKINRGGAMQTTAFNVGDHVMATWKDSQMYPGVVTQVEGDLCLVKWDDGDEPMMVSKDRINHQPRTQVATFNVGDHVAAQWRDSRYYPGVVAEVRGDLYLIKWDDGDEPLLVPKERVTRLTRLQAAIFNVGDHVMAVWKDSQMYPGVVAEARGDQYLIKWDDGDEPLLVARDKMIPFSLPQLSAPRQ
ncbi:MAG TPA: hypothetical protein VLE43_15315 [Candidatus Saccharimonadia bacterium]|nr:hypothetical protein [Candidatus Saccharimonadia bacterium]